MKLFPKPFHIANEVVKRSADDNRRKVEHRKYGGNNFFYLGTPTRFIEMFPDPLRARLIAVRNNCEIRFANKGSLLQQGEGLKVVHTLNKSVLFSALQYVPNFLRTNRALYHNPNFSTDGISGKLNSFSGEDLVFYSDLVFMRDKKMAKPYFKWFDNETADVFRIVQEFLIPDETLLNFEFENYLDDTLYIRWNLSYSNAVISCADSEDIVVLKILEQLGVSSSLSETIREAIVKIRIGQSKFRRDLLDSEKNICMFTQIGDPKLLIAGHIKPWSASDDWERTDIENGILLTPTFDWLFDKFLISFNEEGDLLWSSRLNLTDVSALKQGIVDSDELSVQISNSNRSYFDYHRTQFRKKQSDT